jgi:hypothetical protein
MKCWPRASPMFAGKEQTDNLNLIRDTKRRFKSVITAAERESRNFYKYCY